MVDRIKITSLSKLATERKIGIGSSAKEVRNAYSKAIDDSFSGKQRIVAGSIYGGLEFTLDNDSVSEIFLGTVAE